MASLGKPEDIRVSITGNGAEASILVPADFPREYATFSYCQQKLLEMGVHLGGSVPVALKAFLESLPPIGEVAGAVIARRQPPVHGVDGYVDWIVERESGGSSNAAPAHLQPVDEAEESVGEDTAAATPHAGTKVNHYENSAYIMVERGQMIGKVIEPVPGEDGVDVTGRTLAAKTGRTAVVQLDDTILQLADGTLQAQCDGIFHRTGNKARICKLLEVQGFVDFSTGNIDFQGDVIIHKGVRDCFVVKATSNIEARGLIEAATIEAGGDLCVRGGMAGRERGSVKVGRDLLGKYLDNIKGDVKGDLRIDKEIINCSLSIGGAIRMPNAAIIGGNVAVAGAAEVAEVGSAAGTPTRMVLGSLPSHESKLARIETILNKLQEKRDALTLEQQTLRNNSRFLTAMQKERVTEVMFDIHNVDEVLNRAKFAFERMTQEIDQRRRIQVTVNRQIHRGVVIVIRDQQFRIDEEARGPLQVSVDATGRPVLQRGDSVKALATISRVSSASNKSVA